MPARTDRRTGLVRRPQVFSFFARRARAAGRGELSQGGRRPADERRDVRLRRAATYAPADAPRIKRAIYQKLGGQFTTEEAYGATTIVRGVDVQKGRVRTMLSRWESQGMVRRIDQGVYWKTHRCEI